MGRMRSEGFSTLERALGSTSVSLTLGCLVMDKLLNLSVPLAVREVSGK